MDLRVELAVFRLVHRVRLIQLLHVLFVEKAQIDGSFTKEITGTGLLKG